MDGNTHGPGGSLLVGCTAVRRRSGRQPTARLSLYVWLVLAVRLAVISFILHLVFHGAAPHACRGSFLAARRFGQPLLSHTICCAADLM